MVGYASLKSSRVGPIDGESASFRICGTADSIDIHDQQEAPFERRPRSLCEH
jgi:hypothetical protein